MNEANKGLFYSVDTGFWYKKCFKDENSALLHKLKWRQGECASLVVQGSMCSSHSKEMLSVWDLPVNWSSSQWCYTHYTHHHRHTSTPPKLLDSLSSFKAMYHYYHHQTTSKHGGLASYNSSLCSVVLARQQLFWGDFHVYFVFVWIVKRNESEPLFFQCYFSWQTGECWLLKLTEQRESTGKSDFWRYAEEKRDDNMLGSSSAFYV